MNCKFCQKECCPIGDDHRCFACNVTYHKDFYDMFCWINKTMHCIQIRENPCVFPKAVLVKGHPALVHTVIMQFFDPAPQITPQNIIDKIKTYILFS